MLNIPQYDQPSGSQVSLTDDDLILSQEPEFLLTVTSIEYDKERSSSLNSTEGEGSKSLSDSGDNMVLYKQLDGCWRSLSSGKFNTIHDDTITWTQSQDHTPLTWTEEDALEMTLRGKTYHGKYDGPSPNGMIFWDDGDVWKQVSREGNRLIYGTISGAIGRRQSGEKFSRYFHVQIDENPLGFRINEQFIIWQTTKKANKLGLTNGDRLVAINNCMNKGIMMDNILFSEPPFDLLIEKGHDGGEEHEDEEVALGCCCFTPSHHDALERTQRSPATCCCPWRSLWNSCLAKFTRRSSSPRVSQHIVPVLPRSKSMTNNNSRHTYCSATRLFQTWMSRKAGDDAHASIVE